MFLFPRDELQKISKTFPLRDRRVLPRSQSQDVGQVLRVQRPESVPRPRVDNSRLHWI